jgi:hypothetical protein
VSSQKTSDAKTQTENSSATAQPATCPSCNAPIAPDANFCASCGTALGKVAASQPRDPVTLTIYAIIGICVVGALVGIFFFAGQPDTAPPQATAPATPPASAPSSVDLSSMSPREAADRLFNRVMIADEQGNKEEVMQFLPMVLQAYERVPELDADAHFHLGLIYSAAGDYASTRKEIDILKQYAPKHLLAMLLEHDAALAEGDTSKAAEIETAFRIAYPTEIVTSRPEYQAHLNSIEGFRARIGAQPSSTN